MSNMERVFFMVSPVGTCFDAKKIPNLRSENWGFENKQEAEGLSRPDLTHKPNLPAKVFYGFFVPAGLLTQGSSYSLAFPFRHAEQWPVELSSPITVAGQWRNFTALPVTGTRNNLSKS